MQVKIIKRIVNNVDSYLRYLMCVFAILAILGVFIPTTIAKIPLGNYFGLKYGGRGAVVIIFSLIYIFSALFFRKYFGAVSFVAALVVVIAGVVSGMGVGWIYVGGGMKIVRAARIWMLILSIFNSAVIALKQFVVDKMTE